MRRLYATILLLLTIITITPVVTAGPYEGPASIGDMLGSVFNNLAQFFSMGWLEDEDSRGGLLRFLLFITVFTVLYSAGIPLFKQVGPEKYAQRNAGVFSGVIATITIIFTPMSLLNGIFASYAAVVLFILMVIPVGAVYYLVYPVAGGAISNQWALRIMRIIGLLLIWFILAEVGNYVASGFGEAASSGSSSSPDDFEYIAAALLPTSWLGGDS